MTLTTTPPGWSEAALGELVEFTRKPRGLKYSGEVAFLPMALISESGSDITEFETRASPRSGTYFEEGDFLLARITPCFENGKQGIVRNVPGGWGLATTEVFPMRSEALSARFLAYIFRSPAVHNVLLRRMEGATGRMRVPQGAIKELIVPVPPRAEQNRIVAALEARMQGVAAGKQSLQELQGQLRALRYSMLERAVAGNWPRRPLRDVLTHLRNGTFVSRPAPAPPGVAIFRISAVRPMALDVEDVRYAPLETQDREEFFVQPDDLLFTRYSGNPEYVGACARVSVLPRPTLHPDKLIRAVVDRSVAEPGFLEIACSAGDTLREIRSRRKTTAGQVGIAGGQLKDVLVPVPPLEEQREIMSEVQRLNSTIEEIEREQSVAQALTERLARSLMLQAVAGHLVQQDPADEPGARPLQPIRDGINAGDHLAEGRS